MVKGNTTHNNLQHTQCNYHQHRTTTANMLYVNVQS